MITKRDWNYYLEREFEIEYDDLGIEVEEEYEYNLSFDYNDGDYNCDEGIRNGVVDNWTYVVTPLKEDYATFFNKKVEDLTLEDLEKTENELEDDFYQFMQDKYYDECYDDAYEDASENYSADDVKWED